MDRQGASVQMSPTPQQLLTVSVAVLPRWRAPASHSHSSWLTALSQIYLFLFLSSLNVRIRGACLPPPELPLLLRLFIFCNVTFFFPGSAVTSRAMKTDVISGTDHTTSGTKLKIKWSFRNTIMSKNKHIDLNYIWNSGQSASFKIYIK